MMTSSNISQQQQQAFNNYYEQQQQANNNNIQQQQSTMNSSMNTIPTTTTINRMNQKEIYTYTSDWMIYSLSWSVRRDEKYRLAIGSFIEEYRNKVDIIKLNDDNILERVAQFEHPYPATKIQFHPSASINNPDLIATSGDYLRLWNINTNTSNNSNMSSQHVQSNNSNNNNSNTNNNSNNNTVQKYHTFNNDSSSEFCAPLTSFDWCEYNPNMIGTCSIDTTCTIWDIPTGKSKTQLVAHDKEVYDISFKDESIFCTVGADGSLRMFDLRSLEHCSILYEHEQLQPLLRLAWNKQDPNYIATISMDSNIIVLIDIRLSSIPLMKLSGHSNSVNSISWAPHSSNHLCSVGDDAQALIWDVRSGFNSSQSQSQSSHQHLDHLQMIGSGAADHLQQQPTIEPILEYRADCEINQLGWSSLNMDWISIVFGQKLQILKV